MCGPGDAKIEMALEGSTPTNCRSFVSLYYNCFHEDKSSALLLTSVIHHLSFWTLLLCYSALCCTCVPLYWRSLPNIPWIVMFYMAETLAVTNNAYQKDSSNSAANSKRFVIKNDGTVKMKRQEKAAEIELSTSRLCSSTSVTVSRKQLHFCAVAY